MRRTIAILGTLLIAAVIIISGSAVAQVWHYVQAVSASGDCTNEPDARFAPNGNDATIGENGPPLKLGWILLDLGLGNEMGPSQDFTVFANSPVNETYDVSVSPDTNPTNRQYVGSGWDTENLTFQTPIQPFNGQWRYFHIQGTYGILAFEDPIYGPEIDAVGWYG